jgi:Ca2+-binding EF-hand superfamily protein
VFKKLDTNGDGSLTCDEIVQAIRMEAVKRGDTFSEDQVAEINILIQEADLDHNGLLSYEEFLQVMWDDTVDRHHKSRGEQEEAQ